MIFIHNFYNEFDIHNFYNEFLTYSYVIHSTPKSLI